MMFKSRSDNQIQSISCKLLLYGVKILSILLNNVITFILQKKIIIKDNLLNCL